MLCLHLDPKPTAGGAKTHNAQHIAPAIVFVVGLINPCELSGGGCTVSCVSKGNMLVREYVVGWFSAGFFWTASKATARNRRDTMDSTPIQLAR